MSETTATTFDAVKDVLVETLDLDAATAASLTPSTELLGSLPGLDSMSVMLLLTALAERFQFDVEDVELSGEAFETVGSLTEFVDEIQSN